MNLAKHHWKILQKLNQELEDFATNSVRSFLVIGWNGEGVMLATEPDGDGFWFGKMEFGGGESKEATKPTRLEVSGLVEMAQGDDQIVLLTEQGRLYSMGRNSAEQLGQGSEQLYFKPQPIESNETFVSVRCGWGHSLALTKDGKVWAWGANWNGQVGVPSSEYHPSLHPILELNHHRVVSIECGGGHSLALTDQGQVFSWGKNHCGQLGNETFNWSFYDQLFGKKHHTPTRMSIPGPVIQIAAGLHHTLLLTDSGEVWACGENRSGELGLSTLHAKFSASIERVPSLPDRISKIASHPANFVSIAMCADGECWIWGKFANEITIDRPLHLPPIYSTIDSAYSFISSPRNTPRSVRISDKTSN